MGDQVHDVGQIREVGFVDLDQAQALGRIVVQAGFDQRRFARAPCPREQHIVGRQTLHKLLGVLLDFFFLRLDLFEVFQPQRGDMRHRLQGTMATGPFAVAKGDAGRPIGRRQGAGKDQLHPVHQGVQTLDQGIKFIVHEKALVKTCSLQALNFCSRR